MYRVCSSGWTAGETVLEANAWSVVVCLAVRAELAAAVRGGTDERVAPVRVFFPCTGLGREARGFETFTREAADALAGDNRLEITVFAGGPVPGRPYRVAPSVPRSSAVAAAIGRAVGHDSYFVEQLSFFAGFLPHLVAGRPDVVYFADVNLGNACWHWRRLSGQRYRLLYANGGASTMPYTRADIVQHMVGAYRDAALARGEPAERNVVLPHGVPIPPVLENDSTVALRASLGLPADRKIVVAVGIVDRVTKNLDYVIRELATLPEPRPFLLMLGAESPETPGLLALAAAQLGAAGFERRIVPHEDIGQWYAASDAFVMASLREGFGLAYIEALAHGLPVLAHDFAVTRELLGEFGVLGDFRQPTVLARLITATLERPRDESLRVARHRMARERFSWDRLRDRYADLLLRAAVATPR